MIRVIPYTNQQLAVFPETPLGDRHKVFASIMAQLGAVYNAKTKKYVIDIAVFSQLESQLQAQQFECLLNYTTLLVIKSQQSAEERTLAEVTTRIETTNEHLQQKGLCLYPYQEVGAKKLASTRNFLLGDSPGLGKSVQSLLAASREHPILVIAPAIAKGVWQVEAAKWRPDLAVSVLSGRGSLRWPKPGELVIINYDVLPVCKEELSLQQEAVQRAERLRNEFRTALSKREQLQPLTEKEKVQFAEDLMGFEKQIQTQQTKMANLLKQQLGSNPLKNTVLIVDEAHMLKGKSIRAKRFRMLARMVRAAGGQTWALTGTPLLNNPAELWRLLGLFDLQKASFGNYPTFKRLFNGEDGVFGGVQWGTPDPSVPERLARVMLRRERKSVLADLPEKTWKFIRVPLDTLTQKLADAATKALEAEGIYLNEARDLARVTAKRGAGFEVLAQARKALAALKLKPALEFVELMEEQQEPLLVFASHRAPIDIIGARPGWGVITGSTSAEDRKRLNEEFQAGLLKGLALTIQAGGTALTLTQAAQVLFIDRLWTPALNEQAENRALRIGQTRGVVITILEADHRLDYRVNELLEQKQELIALTLGER